MASTNSSDKIATKTRLQVATEKRKTEEKLQLITELKRQKKMFLPQKVIGPRAIPVNSDVLEIKVEKDAGCCASTVKEELLEFEFSSVDASQNNSFVNSEKLVEEKLEVDNSLIVKVEERFDLEESMLSEQLDDEYGLIEQNQNPEKRENETWSGIETESKKDVFSPSYIQLLKRLVDRKDEEINILMDLIKELESNSLGNGGPENVRNCYYKH